MNNINIFCFGFGQVAKNFIKKLNLEKFIINLSVTTREESKEKKINEISYNNYQFIDGNFDKDLFNKAKKKLIIIKNGDHSLSNKKNLKKITLELNKIVSNII